jgi:hypothetical protein
MELDRARPLNVEDGKRPLPFQVPMSRGGYVMELQTKSTLLQQTPKISTDATPLAAISQAGHRQRPETGSSGGPAGGTGGGSEGNGGGTGGGWSMLFDLRAKATCGMQRPGRL